MGGLESAREAGERASIVSGLSVVVHVKVSLRRKGSGVWPLAAHKRANAPHLKISLVASLLSPLVYPPGRKAGGPVYQRLLMEEADAQGLRLGRTQRASSIAPVYTAVMPKSSAGIQLVMSKFPASHLRVLPSRLLSRFPSSHFSVLLSPPGSPASPEKESG